MADATIDGVTIPVKRTSGLPPEDIYRCIIRKVEVKPGASGHPYLNLECGIDDKRHSDWSGKTFFANLSLSPQAKWKMEEALDALGVPEDGPDLTPDWFMGKRFFAHINYREWEGRQFLQVNEWIPREEVRERIATLGSELEAKRKFEAEQKEAALEEAAELAPDVDDEPEVGEPEPFSDEELDEILDDLWEDE